MRGETRSWAACLALGAIVGCASGEPEHGRLARSLQAFCEADVEGSLLDVEGDYLPSVVTCENGAADFEALRAQAVAARSYLYYALEQSGTIGDGTGDQVYTCGAEPGMLHYMAVDSTSGEVLRYRDTQVAAFYVAGALQEPDGCRGGTEDPTGTEGFVTYNAGRSGDDVEQTSLGFIDPQNYANRGCLSQNGSDCLSIAGRSYREILRFYYGEDIELARSEGPCVLGGQDGGGATGGCAAAGGAGAPAALLLVLLLLSAAPRRALPALALFLFAGCSFDTTGVRGNSEDDASTPAIDASVRDGGAQADARPIDASPCDLCGESGGSCADGDGGLRCEIDCVGPESCPEKVTCPPDVDCQINCMATSSGPACQSGVECADDQRCRVNCTSFDSVTSTGGNAACTGPVDCGSACACDVNCVTPSATSTAGGEMACSGGVTCTGGECSDDSGGCDSQKMGCDSCSL